MLDSVTVTDGRFTMSGTRPAYDLLSLGTTKGVNNIQFFNDGDPLMMDFVNDSLSASPLNERRFTDEFYRLFIASRQAKDEAKKKELEQQIAANQEANNEFARTIIHENRDNVIAAYYLEAVNGYMDYDELASALDSTAYYYNHPLLTESSAIA